MPASESAKVHGFSLCGYQGMSLIVPSSVPFDWAFSPCVRASIAENPVKERPFRAARKSLSRSVILTESERRRSEAGCPILSRFLRKGGFDAASGSPPRIFPAPTPQECAILLPL